MGSRGDAYDTQSTRSPSAFVDSFKTELIADRVWRTRSQLELAVVEYIGWFNDSPTPPSARRQTTVRARTAEPAQYLGNLPHMKKGTQTNGLRGTQPGSALGCSGWAR